MSKKAQRTKDDWIPYARQCIDESDIEAVVEALKSDFVTQGPRVGYFEDGLKEATGARYAIAVSSGTAALHLAYQGLGMGGGDVGIVPSITFAATANALRHCGAEVAWCDVEATSGLAGLSNFEKTGDALVAVGKSPKLLVPVSFAGRLCDLSAISEYAAKHGAYVVEDAAHSIGAVRGDLRSASCDFSDAAILSFHPVKHICAGEGGAVLTNDETLARRVRSLRSHGIEKTPEILESEGGWAYAQTELGWNYRMTDLQASLGGSQLRKLDSNIGRRREIAARYHEAFGEEAFRGSLERPIPDEGSAWHLYVVRFVSKELRRAVYGFMHANGVGVQVHYMPVYRHPYYRTDSPVLQSGAEAFYSGCLSLPMYPSLSDEEQSYVIETMERFCNSTEK